MSAAALDFETALASLKAGVSIRRASWDESQYLVMGRDGGEDAIVWRGDGRLWGVRHADLLAKDWGVEGPR